MVENLRVNQWAARVSKRVFGIMAVGVLPAVVAMLADWSRGMVWASIGAFVVASAAAGYLARLELRRFSCPRCRAVIPDYESTNGQPDAPIRYLCRKCDVLWDTGWRTPSGL